MDRLPIIILLVLTLSTLPFPVRAQTLFEGARDTLENPQVAITEQGGVVRGGVNFRPLVPPARTETILRGSAQVESLCGFDVLASFVEYFEDLPDQILDLAAPLLAGFAFVFLCQSLPSLCDMIKHLHQWANVALRARFAQCQDLTLTAMSAGVALRNDAQGLCLREKAAAGVPLDSAFDECVEGSSLIPGPNDLRAGEFGVVAAVLATAGVDPAVAERIAAVTGDMTLSTSGSVFSRTGERPQEQILVQYANRQAELTEQMTEVVSTMAAGTSPDPAVLRNLGAPGVPMLTDALEALVLETDPVMRAFEIQKLAGTVALAAMVWDIAELEETLDSAMTVSDLTPSQRDVLERTHANLVKQATRIKDLKETIERHVTPQIEALLQKRAVKTAEAAQVALQAASQERLPARYETGQNAFGYRQ